MYVCVSKQTYSTGNLLWSHRHTVQKRIQYHSRNIQSNAFLWIFQIRQLQNPISITESYNIVVNKEKHNISMRMRMRLDDVIIWTSSNLQPCM